MFGLVGEILSGEEDERAEKEDGDWCCARMDVFGVLSVFYLQCLTPYGTQQKMNSGSER